MNEIGDTIEDFFYYLFDSGKFFYQYDPQDFGGLMKQVKISQLW